MENVKMEIKGKKLLIEIDLEYEGGISSSGKSISIASTKGNKDVGQGNIKIGLNVYKPVKSK